MEEVWRRVRQTVRGVMEALNRTADPPRAYTTYMTVMRRLAKLLDHAAGRQAVAAATATPRPRRRARRMARAGIAAAGAHLARSRGADRH